MALTAQIRITKTVAGTPTRGSIRVGDSAGNSITCDPVMTTVASRGRTLLKGIARAEHIVSVTNGRPGLRRLYVKVNGRTFKLKALRSGEVRRLDVASAMRAGDHNKITLEGTGNVRTAADVVIADN